MNQNPENTIYGSYGEFDNFGTDDWTDEDWRQYDEQIAREIAEWEADEADAAIFADYDEDPPF